MNYDEQNLHVNTQSSRLELEIEGGITIMEYTLRHDIFFLIHTEVPASLRGKGIGSAIVKKALQYARDNKFQVVPICGFVQTYLKKHAEWNDIIAPDADRFLHKS